MVHLERIEQNVLESSSDLCCADEKGFWRMRKDKSQLDLEIPGKDLWMISK